MKNLTSQFKKKIMAAQVLMARTGLKDHTENIRKELKKTKVNAIYCSTMVWDKEAADTINMDHKVPVITIENNNFLSSLQRIVQRAIKDRQILVILANRRNMLLTDAWVDFGMPGDVDWIEPNEADSFPPGNIFEVPLLTYIQTNKKEV